MSSFKVNSAAIVEFAAELQDAHRDVEQAKGYTEAHGTFSFHEGGAIGLLFGRHSALMGQLDELFERLSAVTETSSTALAGIAGSYDRSDQQTAARVDAGYPGTPRPPVSRD